MENSSPLIFDISSDEEVGFGNVRKGGGYGCFGGGGGGQFGDMDDCDWLSDLLFEVDGDKNDCSDDVILVSDTDPNPPKKLRSEPPAAQVLGDESDDDDCVVLEGDPDKPVAVEEKGNDDGGADDDDDDDDDVAIVAEKGEVACRDFPHARHLCVKFLFASTPHQVHCTQCHCYVCDSVAPCSQWGTGTSSNDHCHATDKDGYWNTERKRIQRGEKSISPIPINITSPLSSLPFLPAQVPSLSQPVFHPLTPQSAIQERAHPSGCAFRPFPVYRPPPPQLLPVHSRSYVSKSTGSVGTSSPNNSHLHVPLSSVNPRKRRLVQQVTVTHTFHPVQQIHLMNNQNLGQQNYLPSHPQLYSQPYLIQQTTPPPPIYANSTNFMCTAPLPTHVTPQPGAGPNSYRPQNYTPSQTVSPYQLVVGNNAIGSQLRSRITVMPSIQCPGSESEINNQTSQPHARSDPSSQFDNIPSVFQQVNPGQNGVVNLSSNDFGLDWDSQPHGSKENNNRQMGMGPVGNNYNNNYQQNSVVIADNHPSLTIDAGSQFPESIQHDRMDFLFDNLMFEHHSLPGVSEVPVSPLWNNAYSPEPASVDTGNLFDF